MINFEILSDDIQAVFLKPENDFEDLLSVYSPSLEMVEGMSKRDFIEICLHADELFVEKPGMTSAEREELQSDQLKFDPRRFLGRK